jgi:hypothetical protein
MRSYPQGRCSPVPVLLCSKQGRRCHSVAAPKANSRIAVLLESEFQRTCSTTIVTASPGSASAPRNNPPPSAGTAKALRFPTVTNIDDDIGTEALQFNLERWQQSATETATPVWGVLPVRPAKSENSD